MRVLVNGVRLFFDVEGARLVPSGPSIREKPTLLLLHGGPGGKVAMAYAMRHPSHPAKLILISTEAVGGSHKDRKIAMFEKLRGPEVGAMARRQLGLL